MFDNISVNRLVVIGSVSIGIVNCFALAGAPLLSVVWFPVSERTTATALAAMSTYFGLGSAFIAGKFYVFYFILVRSNIDIGH